MKRWHDDWNHRYHYSIVYLADLNKFLHHLKSTALLHPETKLKPLRITLKDILKVSNEWWLEGAMYINLFCLLLLQISIFTKYWWRIHTLHASLYVCTVWLVSTVESCTLYIYRGMRCSCLAATHQAAQQDSGPIYALALIVRPNLLVVSNYFLIIPGGPKRTEQSIF